jgi:thiol-disulfide isomerase/thioredoxin
MIRLPAALLAALLVVAGQQKPPAKPPEISAQEQSDLEKALTDAGTSPVDYLRAIEKHLEKYPDSPRRTELERAAVRAAMQANDPRAIVLYGERVLASQTDDLLVLDALIRSLEATDAKDSAEKALKYSQRYETLVQQRKNSGARPGVRAADWQNEMDRELGSALRYEARAEGTLGRGEPALALARRSFDTFPNADAAREKARWFESLGKLDEAVRADADAFTIPDPHSTDADRARDRGRMGALYAKVKGSEAGLGDLILEAYDRNAALIHARELRLRANDPNAQLTDPMEFTLAGVDGSKLQMPSLKGKAIVLDFWATWCGPCRAQHPLYEQVEQRFHDNPDVVFLFIDNDEDRPSVKPFLEEVKWTEKVYFEDGLSRALNVLAFPTTIVIDRHGQVSSRLTGYDAGRFVDLLSERIREALGK